MFRGTASATNALEDLRVSGGEAGGWGRERCSACRGWSVVVGGTGSGLGGLGSACVVQWDGLVGLVAGG